MAAAVTPAPRATPWPAAGPVRRTLGEPVVDRGEEAGDSLRRLSVATRVELFAARSAKRLLGWHATSPILAVRRFHQCIRRRSSPAKTDMRT